jgi:hypothetical protein
MKEQKVRRLMVEQLRARVYSSPQVENDFIPSVDHGKEVGLLHASIRFLETRIDIRSL